jgi:hypothetical protein
MFHVKHFGSIDGAKILRTSYIRRLETGVIARKTGAIARKSVTMRRRLECRRVRFQAHRLALVGRAERKYDEAETGYLGNAE